MKHFDILVSISKFHMHREVSLKFSDIDCSCNIGFYVFFFAHESVAGLSSSFTLHTESDFQQLTTLFYRFSFFLLLIKKWRQYGGAKSCGIGILLCLNDYYKYINFVGLDWVRHKVNWRKTDFRSFIVWKYFAIQPCAFITSYKILCTLLYRYQDSPIYSYPQTATSSNKSSYILIIPIIITV